MDEITKAAFENVLFTEQEIKTRIRELATELAKDFKGKPTSVILLANGALFFGAELLMGLDLEVQLDIMAVSSYIGVASSNVVTERSDGLKIDIRDRHVVVVDDIFDTGQTMDHVVQRLKAYGPVDIRVCVLLEKDCAKKVDLRPDYSAFKIADQFVVGYGLDHNESFRNLPYIAVLDDDGF